MNCVGDDAGFGEPAHDLVRAVLGARENEDPLDGFALQNLRQHGGLRRALGAHDALFNPFDG